VSERREAGIPPSSERGPSGPATKSPRADNMTALDAFRLDGKVAIITGAGRGIGASIARTYAAAGANVTIASRTKDQLDEVAADVRSLGQEALVIPCDVNESDELEGLVTQTVAELGRVDIVVNNAGGTMPRPFMDTSPGFLERSFHFNVTTAFILSKAATPHLLASNGGAIVNISSAIGRLRDRGFVAYGTAKGALSHMTRLMAADLAPKVRVNGIAVGSIATSALQIVLDNPEIEAEMVRRTPLKRLGQPEDIALCALYLASPAASFVTGKLFEIDGGLEEANLEMGLPDLD
jgi:7-alpha-hydroxysteroid dehydrogenase